MDKIKKTLEKIGLNKNEIKIYLTSLSIGQSPASILGQRNNIVRSTAQYTCQSLVDKKLMHSIQKWNTFLYSPADPEKLLSLINREYDVVEKKFNETRWIMRDLKSIMNPNAKLPKVRYFTWVDGIIEMFEDVINDWNTIYWIVKVISDMDDEVSRYLNNDYLNKRVKWNIKACSIFNDNKKTQEYRKKDKLMNRITKLAPDDFFPFESCVQIYWDKVAFYSYKKWELVWIIVDNSYIKDTMFSIFKMAWNFACILEKNPDFEIENI